MLEVLVGRESPDAPHTTLWFVLPAIAILVLPIVARRRFPFAPAAHWLLAAGIAFVDWRLIPFAISIFVVGLVAAFLLGNLRDPLQTGIGLALVVAGPATVVYKIPGHTAAMLIFIPLEFAISWVAGFALRERAEQAEAAEVRATQAERERDAAARIAVAEERVRSARELHDIVAPAAYRIVQEGLTNALKHARASNAAVTVRYRPDELHIEVRDNGEGNSTSDGLGHGLVGVRERVKIYGGEMSAGTANGSGFILST